MSDLQFPCPSCGQQVQCDAALGGQKIECPICHNSLLAPSPGKGRLSVAAQTGPHVPTHTAPADFRGPQKKKSNLGGILKVAVIIIVLGVLAVLAKTSGLYDKGLAYFKKEEPAPSTNAVAAAEAAAQVAAMTVPPPPPPTPIVWTMDLASTKLSSAPAKGELSGSTMTVDNAIFDRNVLALRQGTNAVPDKEVIVALRLKAGESVEGKTFEVSPAQKSGVPTVMKKWKHDPRYAPQFKTYGAQYAMKLEFGQVKDGAIPGKIYLAFPDTEKSFVAGTFSATTKLAEKPAAPGQTPVASGPTSNDPKFNARYGIK